MYPHPETLSCVVLVYIKDGRDLEKLVRAGQHGRYGLSIIQPILFRKPKPAKWLAWLLIKAPELLRWQDGKPVQPTIGHVSHRLLVSLRWSLGGAVKFVSIVI